MFGLPKFGDGLGLHRIERFFATHGIDREALSRCSIAVTGSNGKGSTSRFIAAALEACGHRAACFTSPHLFDVRERFLLGETTISVETFDRHAQSVLGFNRALPEGDRMGAFEFLFLVAILWLEEERPDSIVWEAGIGGRYDPVRTVKARVSALTSIELEHTALLGATEELIAYDKIDALAPGGTLVVSPSVPANLHDRISAYAKLADKRVHFVAQAFAIEGLVNQTEGTQFSLTSRDRPDDSRQVRLHLIGRHQADNATTAFCAACAWRGVEPSPTAEAPMLAAIGAATWPGRLEHVETRPDLWIDVGHTPHALDLVTDAFLDLVPRGNTLVVFGVSASKEVARIAETVAAKFDRFILTRAHKSGADPAAFASAFRQRAADVTLIPDIAAAAREARQRAGAENLTVLAVGGLFLAVEFEHAWRGGDPTELDFF